MKHITIEKKEGKIVHLKFKQLIKMLNKVEDKRKAKGKRYPLPYLLGSILMAKLAGKQKPSAITEWIGLRGQELARIFGLKRQSVPALNTIRRTLARIITASELQERLREFLRQEYGGQQSTLVVIDGKTLRGTIAKGKTKGLHLIAAYLPAEGIVLAQLPVDKKENEIVVAPKLLAKLVLKRRIVIGDAMQTQRQLSVQVKAQGGDYIWYVKENQPTLLADVKLFFLPTRRAKGWHIPELPRETATHIQKGHGRLEKRTLTLMADSTQFLSWPALSQVFKLVREVTHLKTGKTSTEIAYGITSLSPAQAGAQHMLKWTQEEWRIENGLHYRRDKTLLEDDTRMSNYNQAECMAVINNFIIGLVSKLGLSNLASAQRKFDVAISRFLFAH